MMFLPYLCLLLCVTLDQERPQWTVSQPLHEVVRYTTRSGDRSKKQQLTRTSARVKSKKVKHMDFIRFTDSDEERDTGTLADDGGKVPKNASQALKDSRWKNAMEDDYKSLIDNGVWTLVCKTKNTVPVSGKWCLTLKYGPDRQVTKHKAHYVARGFTQIRERDFDEKYAPTVRMSTIRIVLGTAKYDIVSARHRDDILERVC